MNYFQLASILLPLVIGFVKAAEESNAPGSNKKEAVMDQMKQSWEAFVDSGSVKELKGVEWEAVAPIVSFLIDRLVGGWNFLGVFSK